MAEWQIPQLTTEGGEERGGNVGYPPMKEVVCDFPSGALAGIVPSGSARSVLVKMREVDEDEDPAGDEGDMMDERSALISY
jgi:hypothetical protein